MCVARVCYYASALAQVCQPIPSALAPAGQRAGPAVGAMPIKRAPSFDGGFTFMKQWTVRAGCSKEWHIVNATEVNGDVFVEVGKQIPWVCQTVCNVGRSAAPLRRTSVLERLRKGAAGELSPAPAGGAGADDDDPLTDMLAGVVAHVPRKKKARRSTSTALVAKEAEQPRVVSVNLEREEQCSPQLVRVFARSTTRPTGRDSERVSNLWIHQEDVPCVLTALHADFASRGVPEPNLSLRQRAPEDAGGEAMVSFDVRDGAWVAASRGDDQKRNLKKFYVNKFQKGTREPLHADEYRLELARARAAAEAWVAGTAAEPAGAACEDVLLTA